MQINRNQTEESSILISVFQSIDSGLIVCDNHGIIIMMNTESERLTGWMSAQAKGLNLDRVYNAIDEETGISILPFLLRQLKSGKNDISGSKLILKCRDGKTYRVSNHIKLLTHNGETAGIIILFRDETSDFRLQAEMQKEEKFRALKSLASSVAHDYNNILTAILGNTSLAMMCLNSKEKTGEMLEKIEKSCFKARDFNQKLLIFAADSKPITEKTEMADIVNLVKSNEKINNNIQFIFSIPDTIWPVCIDRFQIKTAIEKLLDNAVQAMPSGGAVKISACNSVIDYYNNMLLEPGRYVCLSVKDKGVGVPSSYTDRIFEPFFTTKCSGSGLGLSHCYSIMKRNGGAITVESEEGKGSTFKLYMPASKPAC
ncbi:MAG: ATP-binding protein [Firmicutes bacterium]|nr:ATP-binding protein [Bacillota bacterium]